MGHKQRRRAQINADIINYQQNKPTSICVFCVICVQWYQIGTPSSNYRDRRVLL